jgi:hypothetical protein
MIETIACLINSINHWVWLISEAYSLHDNANYNHILRFLYRPAQFSPDKSCVQKQDNFHEEASFSKEEANIPLSRTQSGTSIVKQLPCVIVKSTPSSAKTCSSERTKPRERVFVIIALIHNYTEPDTKKKSISISLTLCCTSYGQNRAKLIIIPRTHS